MKFTRKPPTVEGYYWCYIMDPNRSAKASLDVGQVRCISNGFLRTVSGAFDFDWSDWLYWGDKIESPVDIELEKV